MKLTEAQTDALMHGDGKFVFIPSSGNVYATDASGVNISVKKSVFNSLAMKGVIAKVTEHSINGIVTHYYDLTEAGRQALKGEDHG